MSEYVSVDEAAKKLGYKKSYVYKLVWAHAIPVYKPRGGRLRFSVDDLDTFMRRGRRSADYELSRQADEILNRGMR